MNTIAANRSAGLSSVTHNPRAAYVGTEATDSVRLNSGLALIRVITGLVFFAHGVQKVFVYGFGGVAELFTSIGIPFGAIAAPVVALAELLGGLALILGLFTRAAGFGLVPVMLGALFLVHLPAGFFLPNGYEFVLLLAALAAGFGMIGGGTYSADAVIARRRD
jgi:putative oxidoreductase